MPALQLNNRTRLLSSTNGHDGTGHDGTGRATGRIGHLCSRIKPGIPDPPTTAIFSTRVRGTRRHQDAEHFAEHSIVVELRAGTRLGTEVHCHAASTRSRLDHTRT